MRACLTEVCKAKLKWLDALEAQHGHERFRRIALATDGRLLLHLGRGSVLENVGLYCDHTTGLPLIPGTALKGVLSTWACWEANLNPQAGFNTGGSFLAERNQFESSLALLVFGDDTRVGSKNCGEIIFVGGFPADPQNLPRPEPDIVTPHPDNGRGRILPNLFLAWASNSIWEFIFYAKPGARMPDKLLLKTEEWLIASLSSTGLGAKTAAGYGRFRPLNNEEQKRTRDLAKERKGELEKAKVDAKEEARRKALPPEERAFAEYVANQNDWIAAAREIAGKPDQEREWILRYFRSAAGQELLKSWTNEKGKKRIQALKLAGL
ncbi:MAG: type III-B CRISPR module RAMP protein Cmr6 [Candidatus Omnitrophica bacterium]|nr:type III-B CRISPR module RAMP protein Cmr6 [Candidatus Omnitrophota bacterium]